MASFSNNVFSQLIMTALVGCMQVKNGSMIKMTGNNKPKRKYNTWVDSNGNIKIIDMGYDWHTKVPTQAFIRKESDEDEDNRTI